ncbi:anti-sigma factor antagonist [Xylanimonas allomyrinae]|uniref:Anti-sigma factor antagonist n=1 Tax=Xylanimonas allomyrinae TaxID=2509459 RepID=A0A4P6EQ68_9MICO|nr:STAS domain-containing protein [Xylanimonas allomyrinae]QAY64625.1 anti-sigma factor antagonist [Xylanimonas allomyrinae]
MEFGEQDAGTYMTLAPEGRLNLISAPPLKARVDDLVREGRTRVVVDLGAVDHIDSSGLGALVGGLKAARQAGGDLRIARAGEQVRAVLKLTNLDRILVPYRTVEEAGHDW